MFNLLENCFLGRLNIVEHDVINFSTFRLKQKFIKRERNSDKCICPDQNQYQSHFVLAIQKIWMIRNGLSFFAMK